ncbi:hypothetical protein pETSU_051 [Edwardsiella phage pEt-SU]|uniref:Uncharacterized protein n=1 Tax=Edwardsiella phage pEt-SU TaxID=2562142 RepID=A0A4D6DWF7_9CAUD|nr:hypothetical protein HOV39_gp051 [Edwardsiella phage pEt-SU]QBZ70632.1 hypothetical protein pETSU_051 [Edwardsiella phage pEt-SU]
MSKVLPDPKTPKVSADYIYGERMKEYEDRQNFFLDEKVEVKKDDVKEEDKETVDGLEALVSRFVSYSTVKIPQLPVEYDGTEGWAKKGIDFIVQLAKDLVDFIVNLVNNRLGRIEYRLNRMSVARKTEGLKLKEVKYPLTVRRLVTPMNTSTNPNWIAGAIKEATDWYKNIIEAHKLINAIVDRPWSESDTPASVVTSVTHLLGMKGSNSGTLQSAVLPSNRRFVLEFNDDNVNGFKMFFQNNDAMAKLRSETWLPSSFIMDNTLKSISGSIKDIRSNQSTVSQLYRKFEKKVKELENTRETIEPQRKFYSWLIGFDRRLLSTNLQFTMSALDAGLDFVKSGVKE